MRPDIRIRESSETIDVIDCRGLRWWFAIPAVGDHTMSASYETDTLELGSVTDLVATAPARMHGVDCVEIQVNEWTADESWPRVFSEVSCILCSSSLSEKTFQSDTTVIDL